MEAPISHLVRSGNCNLKQNIWDKLFILFKISYKGESLDYKYTASLKMLNNPNGGLYKTFLFKIIRFCLTCGKRRKLVHMEEAHMEHDAFFL